MFSYTLFIGNLSRYPSLLIAREETPLYYLKSFTPYSHQENLIEMLDKILLLSKAKVEEISALVIYSGPGLFTSLRIGFAFAKAFYLKKRDYKLYTINSLDALASLSQDSKYIPCLPAQKNEVFYAIYEKSQRISDYLIGKEKEIFEKYQDYKIEVFYEFPDAETLFKAFNNLKNSLSTQDPVATEPFYIRLPDAYSKLKAT